MQTEIEIVNIIIIFPLATWKTARAFLQPAFSSCTCSDLVSDDYMYVLVTIIVK